MGSVAAQQPDPAPQPVGVCLDATAQRGTHASGRPDGSDAAGEWTNPDAGPVQQPRREARSSPVLGKPSIPPMLGQPGARADLHRLLCGGAPCPSPPAS